MKKVKITQLGDNYENKSFTFVKMIVNRLLDGFFHFKKRKGEICAASATFFILLSSAPILLVMISIAGLFFDSSQESGAYVLNLVNDSFPKLAPWIRKSMEKIIMSQLAPEKGFDFLSFLLFLYASVGVIGSLYFGLNTISRKESKGGYLVEDIKNIFTGLCVSVFIAGLLLSANKSWIINLLKSKDLYGGTFTTFFVENNLLPALLSLGFFTAFYKSALARSLTLTDSFLGALSFIGAFIGGKSFYWIYLSYTKDSMTQSYGNFYTLVIAIFWIYFVNCSFFFGASVAVVRVDKLAQKEKLPVHDLPPNVVEFKDQNKAA